MEINLTSILPKKCQRKLECLWPKLLSRKRFFIPTSIEELKKGSGELKIGDTIHLFSQYTGDDIREFASIIYENSEIKKLFSYSTIYQAILDKISSTLASKDKYSFPIILNSISSALSTKIDYHLFHFPLHGLTLLDINEFSINDILILSFSDNYAAELIKRNTTSFKDDDWTKRLNEQLKEHFINKSVLVISSLGDRTRSEEIAREKASLIVNYLRFIVCLLAYERIDDNLVKISLESGWPHKSETFFYETRTKENLSFAGKRGQRPLQSFEFSNARLLEVKNNAFFDDLCDFIFDEKQSEFERCIMTAIYWIGEAQNDYDRESSFLKYWIALESMLTNKNDRKEQLDKNNETNKITDALCKGISVILSFGGYEFIKPIDIKDTYKKVSALYNVRSNIVHGGAYRKVSAQELSDICKFSSWIVLCLFWLRSYYGIESISEIRPHIDKLYEDVKKHV